MSKNLTPILNIDARTTATTATNLNLRSTQQQPEEMTPVDQIIRENEARLNDLGGGVGRVLRSVFDSLFGTKQKTKEQQRQKNRDYFFKQIDAVIAAQGGRSIIFHSGSFHFEIPDPSLYNKAINFSNSSTANLVKIEQESNARIEAGNPREHDYLTRALSALYIYLGHEQIPKKELLRSMPQLSYDHLKPILNYFHDQYSPEKIVSYLEEAQKINPQDPTPKIYEGMLLSYHHSKGKGGEKEKAQQCFEKALEINPNLPWVNHLLVGTYHPTQKKIIEKHLKAELDINRNSQTLVRFGNLKLHQKKFDEALSLLEEAEKIDPSTKLVNLELARVYEHKKLPEQELEHLQKELENSQTYKDKRLEDQVHKKMAEYYFRQGNPEKSLEIFDHLLAEVPKHNPSSIFSLNFERANAATKVYGIEKTHKELQKMVHQQFVKYSTLEPAASGSTVYYGTYESLSKFRLKHYGFDLAKENLETSISESNESTVEKKNLKSSLQFELATLIFVHARNLPANTAEEIEQKKLLFKQAKENINDDKNLNGARNELSRLIAKQEAKMTRQEEVKQKEHGNKPNTSTKPVVQKPLKTTELGQTKS